MVRSALLALHYLFIIWITCNAADPLKWIAGRVDGSYYIRDTLVLNCSLNHPALPVTLWFSNHGYGNDAFTQRKPDKHLKQTGQIFQIDAIDFSDSGQYECRAANVTPNTIGRVYVSADGIPEPEPRIRRHKGEIELGSEVRLRCEGIGAVILTWFKIHLNGTLTKLAGGSGGTVHSQSGYQRTYNTYIIRYFRQEDNGRYRCVLERPLVKWRAFVDETIESKKCENLTFRFLPPSSSSHIYVNESAGLGNILYHLEGSPSVTWYHVKKDSEELVAYCPSEGTEDAKCLNSTTKFKGICDNSRSDIVFHENHLFVYRPCALYNIQLKAVLVNTCQQLNKTFNITVREVAKIVSDSGMLSMYKSSRRTSVSCEVKPITYPKVITFTWQVQTYSDSECLGGCQPNSNKWITVKTPSEDYDTNSAGFKSVLTLKNNKKPLFIQCIARNSASSDKIHWRLVILADSRKLLKSLTPKIDADEGDNVTMVCEGDSTLVSSVIWEKGDSQISSGQQYIISEQKKSKTDTIYTLKIDKVNVSHGGMYRCVGMRRSQNPVIGNTILVVHEFIYPAVQLLGVTEMQSTSFRIKCTATGYPKPEITWLKDGRPLRLGRSTTTSCKNLKRGIYRLSTDAISNDGNLLFCGSDYKTHAGMFTCTATNSLGNKSASARVRINAAPIIVGKFKQEYKKAVGDSFNVTCFSDGSPRPNILWQKQIDNVFEEIENNTGSGLVFPKIKKQHFGVYRCVARNSYGNAARDFSIVEEEQTGAVVIREVAKSSKSVSIVIGVVVGIVLIALIAMVIILYRRKKEYGGFYVFTPIPITDYIKKLDPHKPMIEQTNKLPYDAEWEFPRNRLKFSRELGSGAFGKVFLAEALGIVAFDPRGSIKRRSSKRRFGGSLRKNPYVNNNKMTKVAVKTLKEDSGEAEYKDLLSELKILIHVGEHKNIVNLLGACTKGRESELWVIIEFCLNGNLLQFLRNRRDIYEPEWKVLSKDPNMQLTMTDLVVAAYQIARGMEFLASRMCIHRDLATRNILVTDNYIIKIADFGLARDVGADNQYIKTSTGLLPVKWMAIEAIIERLFTEKSDVWSFGIVLWELFTLGGTPYPNIPANEISEYLALGNRMCPPHACPEEMSSLMASCWQDDRDDRPSFKELVENLDRIIESHTSSEDGCGYLEVTCDGFMNDYLRPSEIKSPQMDPYELNSPLPPLPSPGNNEHDALLLKDQNGRRKLFDFDKSIKNKAARHDSELEKVEKDSEPERRKDISREGSDVEIDGYIDTSLTGKERERLEHDHDKDRDSSEEPRLSDNYAYWKKSSV